MNKVLAVGVIIGLVLVSYGNSQYMDPFFYVRNAMSNIPQFNGFGYVGNPFNPWTPWYKGPNVCVDEKIKSDDDDDNEKMKPAKSDDDEDSSESSESVETTRIKRDIRGEAETCSGGSDSMKCVARIYNNGVSSTRTRIYTCCEHFVRSHDGSPGCVPSSIRFSTSIRR